MDKPTVASVTADLIAEQDALDAVVAPLATEDWERATPSPRWAVRDQIGHLAFFDMTAALAINNPEGFVTHRESFVTAAFASATSADDATLGETRAMSPPELLNHWRRQRQMCIRDSLHVTCGHVESPVDVRPASSDVAELGDVPEPVGRFALDADGVADVLTVRPCFHQPGGEERLRAHRWPVPLDAGVVGAGCGCGGEIGPLLTPVVEQLRSRHRPGLAQRGVVG